MATQKPRIAHVACRPIALCIVGFVSTLCIPTFIVHSILQTEDENGRLLYTVGLAEFKSLNSCRIFKLNLWLTGLVFKVRQPTAAAATVVSVGDEAYANLQVAPCMLMLFFTAAILYKLEQTRRRRRLIVSGGSLATKRVDAHSDRTTRIILVMLSLFLVSDSRAQPRRPHNTQRHFCSRLKCLKVCGCRRRRRGRGV